MAWVQTTADTTIANLTTKTQSYATGKISDAGIFVDELSTLLGISVAHIHDARKTETAYSATNPASGHVTMTEGKAPTAPTIPSTFSLSAPSDLTDASLSFSSWGAIVMPTEPGTIPTLVFPDIPNKPLYELPELPALGTITIPDVPTAILPQFTLTEPEENLMAPSNQFDYVESVFTSAVKDVAIAEILDGFATGVYGIDTDIEQALWDRDRDRETAVADGNIEEIKRAYGATGIPIPTGPMLDAITKAVNGKQNLLAGHSRDVAINRATMLIEGRKYSLDIAQRAWQLEVDFNNAVQERALNVAKSIAGLAIDVFNAQVNKYNALISGYQAKASVWRERIQAALAETQIYRDKVEGARGEAEIQRLYIDHYRAQYEAIGSAIALYRAEMDGASVHANIEKLRLDSYREEVGVYTAKVAGKEATSRVQVAELGIEIDQARSQMDWFGTLVENYTSQMEVKKAELEKLLDLYGNELTGFETEVGNILKGYGIEHDVNTVNAQADEAVKRINADYVKMQVDNMANLYSTRLKSAGTGANMYVEIAKSSLALTGQAMNFVSQALQVA